MVEILIVAVVLGFIFVYNGWINIGKFIDDNNDIFMMLKESDYDFLLYARYGDRVYDPNQVFMKRLKKGFAVILVGLFVCISSLSFMNVAICFIIGFGVSSGG